MVFLTCKTVGHSTYQMEDFIKILHAQDVDCIVDVRSSPYSRYNPQFNRESLIPQLAKNQIHYLYMGDKLGARYKAPYVLFPDGRVDFKKVRALPNFQVGIESLIQLIQAGHRIALMCAEKNPFDCHRFVLVAYALTKRYVRVLHIITADETIDQEALEDQLLRKYKKTELNNQANYNNILSYSRDPQTRGKSPRDLFLEESYEQRNKDIAFIAKSAELTNFTEREI